MIKKVENMKKILFFLSIVATCMLASCGSVYDNIDEYATEETVYVGKCDPLTGAAGFERAEINLLEVGRIPSSEVKLGKAKKTVVEYDDQVITYEEVKSWVNVTGLTTPKLYRFSVYNIDEFGNKSVPEEIALIPYTSEDFNALVFPDPYMNISPTAAEISWPNGLTSGFFEFVDMVYTYTDVNGTTLDTIAIENPEDPIRFVMLNMEPTVPVQVSVKCRIIPKVSGENIIDTILFSHSFTVTPTTVEEYLASRTYRRGTAFVTNATDGRVRWGAVTDHLVLTEVRYKTSSGELKVVQTPASEIRTDCPGIMPGELYEYRCGYVPTASIDTFYNAWRMSASTFLLLPTGTFTVDPSSYRDTGSGSTTPAQEYAQNNKVTIEIEGNNKYKISDLMGGFYVPGRWPNMGPDYEGYNEDQHVCWGIFSYDGSKFTLLEFKMDGWGYGFDSIDGNWDGANETLNLKVDWAGYIFNMKIILEI
jgi:hypothetical protein